MADRAAVLEKAIATNRQYLANTGGLGYAEKIKRYEAELAAIESVKTAQKIATDAAEWSGSFSEAIDRFDADLIERQKARGEAVAVPGVNSGFAFTAAENIEAARQLGVLDELGGELYFSTGTPEQTWEPK